MTPVPGVTRAGRSRAWPVVTFLTDFGTRDSYVAEMKGVILGLTRTVHLVDLTHEIAAHDVVEAALVLQAAVPAFPPGTIHVVVVDPGVGTERRGLVVTARGHLLVGPDNGVFSAFVHAGDWRAWELDGPDVRRPAVSATFHGRDVFAPAAARLALGRAPSRFGPRVRDPVTRTLGTVQADGRAARGRVVHVDRFGNLVTSIRAEDLRAFGPAVEVSIGRRRLPLVRTYGELGPGRAGALIGSQGRLEVAVREASAARRLGLGAGTTVVVRRASRRRRAAGVRAMRTRSSTT